MDFLRGVLSGEKKMFRLSNINIIDNLPRYPEISLKDIWERVRVSDEFQPYFPDKTLHSVRPPNRTYLFTVL